MLSLTKKAGYGLIAMTHLARLNPGELASAREIAGLYGVPSSLLMNVLKVLAVAGYVESIRGAHGGYRLAHEPEEISLADVISAVEGPIRLAECIAARRGGEGRPAAMEGAAPEGPCPLIARCPIADPVHRVHRRLHDFLKTVTLAEIVGPVPVAE